MSRYAQYVEKHRQLILQAERDLWKMPETGYREWKTHAYLEEAYAKLGYELTLAGDIPGFTAEVDTGIPGPTVAVFGELDSMLCSTHPEADPQTGAVHACGHHAQSAALLGLAAALKEPGVLDGLCGKIRLVAVPAEELIELDYREELYRKGIIRFFGGKPEFMARGLLDGVDMAIMVHTSACGTSAGSMDGGSNGCIAKSVSFQGVTAHAGAAPHRGVNALYAANLALNAINALRETFRDEAHIRVHPILSKGGDVVNTIPDHVCMESFVRGKTMDDIVQANKKINRAIAASAAAMGAKAHLRDIPGYWPRKYPASSFTLMKQAMEQVLDKVMINPWKWGTGCSDMGDVGAVMPALHPHIGGAAGNGHGSDYYITDPETACIKSAELQLMLLGLLLQDDGQWVKKLVEEYKPAFGSIAEYLDYVDKLNIDLDAVSYGQDGSVVLRFAEE